ncbi:MAG: lactate dehydrogenase [Nitrosopumilus sp.]|uniref:malate dehydrogenase n=1 Tax=Nitrosopumilus sp. TaxID=2024843 RepID=UPI00247C249D|nr:lactate dehydrogenase [Nitrosopumilus sp.]MCV0391934.1 lactate dehydrogenase [Nitrosopumilus sp.]
MISIIGSGQVGSSIAFLCMSNEIDNVLLVNRTEEKAIGEALDISNSIPSSSKFSIRGTSDYSKLVGSDIVVVTASVVGYQKDRTENIRSQVNMIKEIAKNVKEFCPSAIVLIVSNPLDVLTYYFQIESCFSRFRVIGIASSLDSSRFRYFISEKFSVPQSSVSNALVLGEHGDTMVPIFSKAKVSGRNLLEQIDETERSSITGKVRNYWKLLRNYKSRSQFGIAKNTYDVISAIIHKNELKIPASIVLEGEYGVNNVSMGIPVKINHTGVVEIEKIALDNSESELLALSAKKIQDDIKSVKI